MFWVFFLTGSLRAGLMSCVSSTGHPKVSLCVILCGKETQKKKKEEKEQQTTMGTGRLEDARKGWKSCSLEERETGTC